jgi:hypothetical protein
MEGSGIMRRRRVESKRRAKRMRRSGEGVSESEMRIRRQKGYFLK